MAINTHDVLNSDIFKQMLEVYEKDLLFPLGLFEACRLPKVGHHDGQRRPPVTRIESAGIRLGEVEGWRLWRADGHRLRSVTRDVTWLPGVPMSGDPTPTNHAGVYAVRDQDDAYREFHYGRSMVLGTVRLWGRYVEHERGYRAEFARITSICGLATMGDVDINVLRSLYIDLRCPTDMTQVVDSDGRVVGVTTVQSSLPRIRTLNPYSGRYVEEPSPPIVVCEPVGPLTSAAEWLKSSGPGRMLCHQYHRWRGRALLLESGQDPTWLPGWLPLPSEAAYG